jgi:hypothetical protein
MTQKHRKDNRVNNFVFGWFSLAQEEWQIRHAWNDVKRRRDWNPVENILEVLG